MVSRPPLSCALSLIFFQILDFCPTMTSKVAYHSRVLWFKCVFRYVQWYFPGRLHDWRFWRSKCSILWFRCVIAWFSDYGTDFWTPTYHCWFYRRMVTQLYNYSDYSPSFAQIKKLLSIDTQYISDSQLLKLFLHATMIQFRVIEYNLFTSSSPNPTKLGNSKCEHSWNRKMKLFYCFGQFDGIVIATWLTQRSFVQFERDISRLKSLLRIEISHMLWVTK